MSGLVYQASAVLHHGRVVLIEGPPGSGKSSLALALIDRGATLVGDDGVSLSVKARELWASAPPNIAGLIEVRNVGLARMPAGEGPVGLVIRLDPVAERYREAPDILTILGIEVPLVSLFPDTPALPLRAEWALRLHARGAGSDR